MRSLDPAQEASADYVSHLFGRVHISDITTFLETLQSKAFNRTAAPRVVLVSPIPNENVHGVAAADQNNSRIKMYTDAMHTVAEKQGVGFVDVFRPMLQHLDNPATDLTINGCHLNKEGYDLLSLDTFFTSGPEESRAWTVEKNTLAPKAASVIASMNMRHEGSSGDASQDAPTTATKQN